jgi:putative phage-type endonuclease
MLALEQQTDEWLETRKRKIGASDAPVIMEVSPWKTPYKLWAEKVGIENDTFVSKHMQEGINKEPEARENFIKKTNIYVYPKVVFHDSYDWMMASLDGIDMEAKHIVEIKNVNAVDHAVAQTGKVPEKYYPQLQHQLEVTGLDMAYYFSYRNGDGVIVEVGRDDKYINELLEKEKSFFACMQDFIAPNLTKKDYVEVDDENFCKIVSDLKTVQKNLALLTKQEEMIKKELIHMCELNNYTNIKCDKMQISKCMRKGNIEYSKIEQLKKIDLEIFRKKPTQYWRVVNSK